MHNTGPLRPHPVDVLRPATVDRRDSGVRAGAYTVRSSTPPVDELGETNLNHVRQDLVVVPYGHH
ncbi:hypothetical protein ACFFX0_03065 [Citricoccus parietis]|uniref:Uncharacterized protein n=1 Tax=Citricoccus parietis TaxID=592307 RepID=A0ABV5FU59_9MICC